MQVHCIMYFYIYYRYVRITSTYLQSTMPDTAEMNNNLSSGSIIFNHGRFSGFFCSPLFVHKLPLCVFRALSQLFVDFKSHQFQRTLISRLPIFNLFHKMIFLDFSGCISLQLQLQLSKRREIPGPHALHDNTRVGCQGCHLCRIDVEVRFSDIQPPNAVDERYPASN